MSMFLDEIRPEFDAAMAVVSEAITHEGIAVSRVNAVIRTTKEKFARPGVTDEDRAEGQKLIDTLVAHAKAIDPRDPAVLPGTNPDAETATDAAVKAADAKVEEDKAALARATELQPTGASAFASEGSSDEDATGGEASAFSSEGGTPEQKSRRRRH